MIFFLIFACESELKSKKTIKEFLFFDDKPTL